MKALIELLMKMGKTKEEALEIIGKDLPTGGIDNVSSNILKPITKKVVGDYPLVGSRITDPTSVKNFDLKSISESIADQEKNWKKTFEFLSEGGYNLSALQKQNLTYNLGILKRSKDTVKNLSSERFDVLGKYLEKRDTLFGPEKADVFDLTGKKIDTSKPILGGKNVELTHNEKIDWLVKNVSPTAEQTIPPKAALEAMLKDGREDLIDHFFEMHTKELGKPKINIDTSGLKHPELVKKMMMDKKLKPTLVKTEAQIKKENMEKMREFIIKNQSSKTAIPLPDIVTETIAVIKSKKPIDAMAEANSVIGRKGKYKNLTEEQSQKIIKDTEDHIFERDIKDFDYKENLLKEIDNKIIKEMDMTEKELYAMSDDALNNLRRDADPIRMEEYFSIEPKEPKDFANISSMRPTDDTLNKLVEEHSNNLRLINQTDAEGGTAIGYEKFKALQKRNEEIERIIENAKKVADEEDAAEAIGKAISADSPEGKEITEKLLEKIDQASGENVIKLENPVDEIIASIKALEPIDAMKEANSVLGKQGKYKNLSDEQINKIIEDTNDHIFERDIPDDPDFAQGGIIGLK